MTQKVVPLPLTPPEPTLDNPYCQLDWLYECFIQRYNNERTKKSHINILAAYKNFLKSVNGFDERLAEDPRFYLSVHCDQLVLYNFEHYMRNLNHAPNTIASRLISLRQVFEFAARRNLTYATVFLWESMGRLRRATLQREAYEDAELQFIKTTFKPEIDYAKRIVAGYKSTGVGKDPRRKFRQNYQDNSTPPMIEPWSVWENYVWYFENVLNSQPIISNKVTSKEHGPFLQAAARYYGSIREVWRRLGVTPFINNDLIFPLAMKLCWETGLNAETLFSLQRDCFKNSHPLTGRPYIRYYKERSTGEKELHVSLFDAPDQLELPLLNKQSLIIQRTIEVVLNLTEPLVSKAKESDKNYLFLYQASFKGVPPTICRLSSAHIWKWSNRVLRTLKETGAENIPILLNLARFRPTKITQMVREGRDIFDIQAIAGHRSLVTTMQYLNDRQIMPKARREIAATLQLIHENRMEFERNPKPYAKAETLGQKGVIYKGILCDCKNVYNPPQRIRSLPIYKEGQPCTYYNMCLSCPNIIITKNHLPVIVVYKHEVEQALATNNVSDAPNGGHYERILSVLDGVLLEFDEAEITWAYDMAQVINEHIDPTTYRGVINEETR